MPAAIRFAALAAVLLASAAAGAQEFRDEASAPAVEPIAPDGTGTVVTPELFTPEAIETRPHLDHPRLEQSLVLEPELPVPLVAHPAVPSTLVPQPLRAAEWIALTRPVGAPAPESDAAPQAAPVAPRAAPAPRPRIGTARPRTPSLEAARAWLARTDASAREATAPPARPVWPFALFVPPAPNTDTAIGYAPAQPQAGTVPAAPEVVAAPTRTQRAASGRAAGTRAGAPLQLVGSRLPATLELYAFPADFSAQVPSIRSYRYAVLNGRVLLVDPATRTVVGDITE